jgi:hypothetical protein
VANEYVSLRGIPPTNVFVLSDVGIQEAIGVEAFREKILVPILRHLEQAKLSAQVDYIVYSTDFPYRVDVSADLPDRKMPKQVGRMASLTGLTYLYQPVLLKRPEYLDFTANWYALQPFQQELDPPWSRADRERYGEVQRFFIQKRVREAERKEPNEEDAAWEKRGWEQALVVLRELLERHPHSLEARYNLACGLSVLGKLDEAMAELTRTMADGWSNMALASAARNGWRNYTDMAKDGDLTPLRDREDFKKLVAEANAYRVHMPAARAFDASTGWTKGGDRCQPYKGSRYFLSTMLGYTGGRGNSYGEVIRYLRRARDADGTDPKGTIYYLKNGDVRSVCREWAMSGAVQRLREDGIAAEIDNGKLPKGRKDVAGAMVGTATFDWQASGSTILPGAICEHLTSFGGVMGESSGQTPLSAFLAAGAAGASGTVAEPFAIQAKFPNAFIQAYYAEGCSLAEAFYQSVTGPYQLLIVGDPLCQPWAKAPTVDVQGLAPNQVVKGNVKVGISVRQPGVPALLCQLYLDGHRFATVPPKGEFNLPTEKLSEGSHELRVVALAADEVQAQGRTVIPFLVANADLDREPIKLAETEFRYGERIPLEVNIPDAARVDVFGQFGKLGGLDSGQGTVHVDTTVLGLGPVTLRYGVSYGDGNTRLSGTPLEVTILPPKPLSLPDSSLPEKFADGIQLLTRTEGKKAEATVASLRGDWLRKADVGEGTSFAARGYFDVPEDGVYQFQFQGNLLGSCRVKVDDEPQPIPAGDGWRALLVSLRKGTHSLTLSGRGTEKPRLDVRFGGPGCRTVDDKRFRRGAAE